MSRRRSVPAMIVRTPSNPSKGQRFCATKLTEPHSELERVRVESLCRIYDTGVLGPIGGLWFTSPGDAQPGRGLP